MLQPKRMKYPKHHKNWKKGLATRGNEVSFGDFGLRADAWGKMTSRQIEAARRTITRHIKRQGEVWIRIFPDKPITKKPLEVRMGKGKGSVDHYVSQVQPGRILFEIGGVNPDIAHAALKLAAYKLPVKTTVIKRGEVR